MTTPERMKEIIEATAKRHPDVEVVINDNLGSISIGEDVFLQDEDASVLMATVDAVADKYDVSERDYLIFWADRGELLDG